MDKFQKVFESDRILRTHKRLRPLRAVAVSESDMAKPDRVSPDAHILHVSKKSGHRKCPAGPLFYVSDQKFQHDQEPDRKVRLHDALHFPMEHDAARDQRVSMGRQHLVS